MAKMGLQTLREEAAQRYKALKLKKPKTAAVSNAAFASTYMGPVALTDLPTEMDPGGLPHYYGPFPNYANSPMPNLTTTITPTTVGNELNDRAYASDYQVSVGELAAVFVVVPSAVLPAGSLVNFQTWNQATNGFSLCPSAGNIFYAYVLRPTGTLNQYTVVFNSSELTVPDLTTPGTSEIATFDVTATPFTVQAGDVIGFYGQGIPFDILSHPALTQPVVGNTITIGENAGFYRDYAIAATIDVSTSALTGGIHKFVDPLPDIPVATPEPCTYSGPEADCYDIGLVEYNETLHTDLPPTRLRGYVQLSTSASGVPLVNPADGSSILMPDGTQAYGVGYPQYLGPTIVAQKDRPVRIRFFNLLPTNGSGDLFLPVDTTIMGSGPFMIDNASGGPYITGNFSQNRATVHLHGGFNTWISDGTVHQWITPAGEETAYPEGVSVENVPDMPDPGDGSMTLYYNNMQGARLQFYHDHAFGITRLNVYAGEAAAYLVTDEVEKDMIEGTDNTGINPDHLKVLPDIGIPLIIQDKTFVDATTIAQQDPTWNWGTGARDANGNITEVNTGDLWLPHVYMPNQNPADPSGMNAFGRWQYSPWFYPAPNDVANGPIPNPYCLPTPGVDCSASDNPLENTEIPDVPNPSFAMEAFMDTAMVNGKAYPYLNVEPKAYRFRILDVANDRFVNLQMYVADSAVITADGRVNTEVKMVPAVATTGYPAGWPTDGRDGGVPDPATAGPSFIQIGTEGGFLPAPVELPNLPVGWNLDQTNFDMGLVNKGTLIMGPAERADVIVDFSKFRGKTIILYNDAPAPFPAVDARYDYYTGNPDTTDTGGAPSTLAGYGPNTRTIMQFRVNDTAPAAAYDLTALKAVFAKNAVKNGVFETSQDEIIVAQDAYNTAYNKVYPTNKFVRINDKNLAFNTANGTPMNIQFQLKGIHDEASAVYSTDDGRMSAMLGLTIPGIPGFVPVPFLAPPVELVKDSVYGTQLGSLEDGTQIWKVTHNGVDTHPIHVHLYNAQVINRVAWDNAIRKVDLNELGWKETIRMNPLQDTIIAFRAVAPPLPFNVPNSVRLIDPTMPEGVPMTAPSFGWKDPNGNPVTVFNNMVNFGWEYLYHCHILGHEEMDMMHDVSLVVAPDAPNGTSAIATLGVNRVTVNWTDNSTDETGFIVQRNTSASAWITLATVPSLTGRETGGVNSYIDTTVEASTTYNYRVIANNVVGDTTIYAAPSIGFPTMTANSTPSDIVTVTTPVPFIAPTDLAANILAGPSIVLTWTDVSNNEDIFNVWRSDDGASFTNIGTVARTPAEKTATGGPVTFTNTNTIVAPLVAGQTYSYYVTIYNISVGELPSNTATILYAAPVAPSELTGTVARAGGQDSVTLTWTDNSNNEQNFEIQRATTDTFTEPSLTTFTVGADVVRLTQNVNRRTTYFYRILATNPVGNSAWSNTYTTGRTP